MACLSHFVPAAQNISLRAIHDVKATDMGMSQVRFKAEVDFDGRVVTRSYLERQDIEQLLQVCFDDTRLIFELCVFLPVLLKFV